MLEHGVGAVGATFFKAEMKTVSIEEVLQVWRGCGDVDWQTQGGLFVDMNAGSRESETDYGRGGPPKRQGKDDDEPVRGDDGARVHSVEKCRPFGPWHLQVATSTRLPAARRSLP